MRDYDKLMQLKLQTDSSYRKMRDELIDSEQLLKSVPDGFNEVDKKYEDALLKIDKMSTNPNFSQRSLAPCTMRYEIGIALSKSPM